MLAQRLSVRPSVLIAVAVGAVHLAAAGFLWLLPLPLIAQALLTLATAASLVYFMARDAALHSLDSIVALEVTEGGGMAYQTRRGAWLDGEVLGSSYVSPRVTIVNLRTREGGRRRRVILVSDNVDARDFRRLRIWLKWKSGAGQAAAPSAEG